MFDWWDKVDSAISTIISTVQEVKLRTDARTARDEEVKLQLAEIKDNIKILTESLLK